MGKVKKRTEEKIRNEVTKSTELKRTEKVVASSGGMEKIIGSNWEQLKKELQLAQQHSATTRAGVKTSLTTSATQNKPMGKWAMRREQIAEIYKQHRHAQTLSKGAVEMNSSKLGTMLHKQPATSTLSLATSSFGAVGGGHNKVGRKQQPSPASPLLPNVIALDCEYVGVGYLGEEDCLARVSIVNSNGEAIYDKYVRADEAEVVDYRTEVSGIRPGMLRNGEPFAKVQQEVSAILNGHTTFTTSTLSSIISASGSGPSRSQKEQMVVVGHAVHNDFKVLQLSHPHRLVRDTAKYKPLRQMSTGEMNKMPPLRVLAQHLLGVQIHQGEHDSVMDARIAMRLYLLHREKWEREFKQQLAERRRRHNR